MFRWGASIRSLSDSPRELIHLDTDLMVNGNAIIGDVFVCLYVWVLGWYPFFY